MEKELDKKTIKKLIEEAKKARKNAFSPKSGTLVGAAVLAKSGKIYRGANIGTPSGTPYGDCAEIIAIQKTISEGEDINFIAIAIIANIKNFCYPCGICRQAIIDYSPNCTIIVVNDATDEYQIFKPIDLLPFPFLKGVK